MSFKKKIRKIILESAFLRELYFFICNKKINKGKLDKVIKNKLENPKYFSYFENQEIVENLVVSLTTFGERLNELHYTLFSLVEQTIRPEAINVWLDIKKYNRDTIPQFLLSFEKFNVNFYFDEDIRAYTKFIHQARLTPEKDIVVCDDDIFYQKKWLEKLVEEHKKYPNDVTCHIAHKIKVNSEGEPIPYNFWVHNISLKNNSSLLNFPCGVGGVVWNMKYLYSDILKKDLFMKLSPLADDVWLYFMAYLKNTKIRVVPNPINKLKYIDIYKEYGLNSKKTLQSENVENCRNDEQIKAIMEFYNLRLNEDGQCSF